MVIARTWQCGLVVLTAACADSGNRGGSPATLTAEIRDSAHVRIVTLGQSLLAAARGQVLAETVSADLTIGGVSLDHGFANVADIASFRDGGFAILDDEEQTVFVHSRDGTRLGRILRDGDGPGELRWPIAMAAVGEMLVVLMPNAVRPFTVVTPHGEVIGVHPAPGPGDWATLVRRGPFLARLGTNRTRNAEDWSRRIQAFGESTFVHHIQADEYADGTAGQEQTLTVHLIKYRLDATVVDTLDRLRGALTVPGRQLRADIPPIPTEEVFGSRAVWASWNRWLAVGHGRASEVVVKGPRDTLLIRWPSTDDRVTERDKLTYAMWVGEYNARRSAASRENAARVSARDRDRAYRQFVEAVRFADRVPNVVAVYGAGSCLWLAGFSPEDYVDGTARTWIAVSVPSGDIVSVVRLPESDRWVRHIDERAIYATYRDSLDVPHVERYPLPGGCEA